MEEKKTENDIKLYRYLSMEGFSQLLFNGLRVSPAFLFEDDCDCQMPIQKAIEKTLWTSKELVLESLLKKCRSRIEVFGALKFYIRNMQDGIHYFPYDKSRLTDEKVYNFSGDAYWGKGDGIEKCISEIESILWQEQARARLVSCWSEKQGCDAMWKCYARKGVCIQTTRSALLQFFKDVGWDVDQEGSVEYLSDEGYKKDFEGTRDNGKKEDLTKWILKKRKTFEYEKEYRMILKYSSDASRFFQQGKAYKEGVLIPGGLQLIKDLEFSPYLEGWERDILKAMAKAKVKCEWALDTTSESTGEKQNPPNWGSDWRDCEKNINLRTTVKVWVDRIVLMIKSIFSVLKVRA